MSYPELATIPSEQEFVDSDPLLRERVQRAISSSEVTEETRAALYEALFSRPAELMIAEVQELLSIYQHRAIEYTDGEKNVIRFATRHVAEGEPARIDDDYRITEDADGNLQYYARIMPYKDLGYSFRVTPVEHPAGEQAHTLQVNVITGSYEIPIRQDGNGQFEDALQEIVKRTINTARIVNDRAQNDPVASIEADEHAWQLLAERVSSEHSFAE